MSNYLINCQRCKTDNPLFQSVCKKCGTIIRNRVPSIDLWKIFGLLIENPKNAFIEIFQSEQKNFATPVLAIALFKIYLFSTLLAGVLNGGRFSLVRFVILFAIAISLILLIGFILKKTLQKKMGALRIKDFYAGVSFSFTPQLIGLFILFGMEFIVFGEQLFTFNPSPFLIKKNFAYLFLILEIGIIIWNVSLTTKFFAFYFKKSVVSIMSALAFIGGIYFVMNIFL